MMFSTVKVDKVCSVGTFLPGLELVKIVHMDTLLCTYILNNLTLPTWLRFPSNSYKIMINQLVEAL